VFGSQMVDATNFNEEAPGVKQDYKAHEK